MAQYIQNSELLCCYFASALIRTEWTTSLEAYLLFRLMNGSNFSGYWQDEYQIAYLRSEGKGDPSCGWCHAHRWGWNIPLAGTQVGTQRRWIGQHWSQHPPQHQNGKVPDQGTPVAHKLGKRTACSSLFWNIIFQYIFPKASKIKNTITEKTPYVPTQRVLCWHNLYFYFHH